MIIISLWMALGALDPQGGNASLTAQIILGFLALGNGAVVIVGRILDRRDREEARREDQARHRAESEERERHRAKLEKELKDAAERVRLDTRKETRRLEAKTDLNTAATVEVAKHLGNGSGERIKQIVARYECLVPDDEAHDGGTNLSAAGVLSQDQGSGPGGDVDVLRPAPGPDRGPAV